MNSEALYRKRTYRRRRAGAAVAALAGAFFLYSAATASADSKPSVYTVRPGDTLWEIATRNSSFAEDPRVKVEEIRKSNHLPNSTIRPGEVLKITG